MFRHIERFKQLPPGQRAGGPEQGRRLWDLSQQLIAQARQPAHQGSLWL
jgi:hypothetical protein